MNRWIDHMRVRTRFVALGLVALLLTAVPTALHLRSTWATMSATSGEVDGITPAKALLKVIQLTQQHRGLSALFLGNQPGADTARAGKQNEVDQAIEAATAALKALPERAAVHTMWARNAKDWLALRDRVAARGATVPESFAGHTALLSQLLQTVEQETDDSGLSLDPVLATYKLMAATNYTLPTLTEALGKARAKGTGMLATKSSSGADQTALTVYTNEAQTLLERMQRDFQAIGSQDRELASALEAPMKDAAERVVGVIALARNEILGKAELGFASGEYFKRYTEAIDALVKVNEAAFGRLQVALDERLATERRGLAIMAAVMALMIAGGGLFIFGAGRSITRQLGGEPGEVVAVVNAIAQGDLSTRIAVPPGAQGSVVDAMAQMQASLARTVTQVRQASDSIATGSAEIATGNQDLSSRTEAQASNLEQTAASMEELNATVKNNADTARQASQLAGSASAVAAKGGEVVGRVVTTMSEITESSRRIAEIIGTIDGIAFQTNILALNAAVEAARAGEQGRGFAVVAGEVRALAQRSAEAAKEIKSLIGTSVDKVEAGSKLVDEAGHTMSDIVAQVQRVSDLINEISAATGEQTSGIGQVNEAVTQLDQMTQQNAALVEESAAAAESLKLQAHQMVQAVAVFRTGAHEAAASRAALPLPAAAKPDFGGALRGQIETSARVKPSTKPSVKSPSKPVAEPKAPAAAWNGEERRGPNRAKNVARLPAKEAAPTAVAGNGTEGEWESF